MLAGNIYRNYKSVIVISAILFIVTYIEIEIFDAYGSRSEIIRSFAKVQKRLSHTESAINVNKYNSFKSKPKVILLWNSFWGTRGWEAGLGSAPFHRLKCPVKNCLITDNKETVNQSDAILFHIHELKANKPEHRLPHQRWVFWMLECPVWSRNMRYKSWNGLFNWTMTYRQDSDIKLHYGRVWKRKKPELREMARVVKFKKKLVAWIVSNCNTQSKRLEYVQELQKYIPVDIYGRCGNLNCKKDWLGGDANCMSMINRTYKFYISFENSFCKDYITEKVFKILPMDLVPIVRGAAHYPDFIPGDWYIDALDFVHPKELATYLYELHAHPDEYMRYLAMKPYYDAKGYFGPGQLPSWCDLCKKLNDVNEPPKVYDRIDEWWSEADCYPPTDINAKGQFVYSGNV